MKEKVEIREKRVSAGRYEITEIGSERVWEVWRSSTDEKWRGYCPATLKFVEGSTLRVVRFDIQCGYFVN